MPKYIWIARVEIEADTEAEAYEEVLYADDIIWELEDVED